MARVSIRMDREQEKGKEETGQEVGRQKR
jgi:hypothetical protein